jgi:superfamily II DNA or RNA helicase
MLRRLKLKGVYKSDQDNILQDFYFPALSVARSYDRAVGFFSASTLSHAAQALSVFIKANGHIRLILGAFADPEDIEAVKRGHMLREISDRIGRQFLEQLGDVEDELFGQRFKALAWLVAHNRLNIKVALRPKGMYHDKIGIITDADGDAVVFAGSANESASALLPIYNYESIDVFPTWKNELTDYFEPHQASFERLWSNTSRGTAVIDVPTAMREKLLIVAQSMDHAPDPTQEAAIDAKLRSQADIATTMREVGPRTPQSIGGMPFQIRPHQREALNAWRTKGAFQGIFDLATGAGKTITAIYAVVRMAKQIPGLAVVIAAPYQSLADQWCDILNEFNINPLQCYVSRANWSEDLQRVVHDLDMGVTSFEAIVVVNRTLKTPEFQSLIARIPDKRFLWIGDECHHHASEAFVGFLPRNAQYRIGLSATPEHYLDPDRNARLKDYYGDIVYSYSLKQAIEDGVLTPYNYFPRLVELTGEEAQEFGELCDEIAAQVARDKSKGAKPSQALTALLMRRARIIASAVNKLPALVDSLSGRRPESHSLYYCGDGQVDFSFNEEDDDEDIGPLVPGRQIEVVSQLLDNLGWRISRFTARESRGEREAILRNFRIGLIDALVAIKCLDEGIDVPACSTAYILASSRDPRQFIQRRGRILRRSPGKTIASIHDFIVVLPEDAEDLSGAARNLIRSELRRVAEFSALAQNRYSAYETLRPVLLSYNLEHLI